MPRRCDSPSYGAPWGNLEGITVKLLRNLRYRRLRLRKRTHGFPPLAPTSGSTMTATPDARGTSGITGTTTIATLPVADAAPVSRAARPDIDDAKVSLAQRLLDGAFVGVPIPAPLVPIPCAWRWGPGCHAIVIGAVFYW